MSIVSTGASSPTGAALRINKALSFGVRPSLVASITLALAVYVGLFIAGDFVLRDPDTLWHIKVGQWILQHGQLPRVDFYSYTEAGRPWIDTAWLSDVFYALAYEAGGWRAVALVANVTGAAVIGVISFYLQQHVRFSVSIGCAGVVAWGTFQHFMARPHLFSYLLLLVWLIALLNAFNNRRALPPLYMTAPLMVLWTNLHGSFTLGLLMLYIFAGFCVWSSWSARDLRKCRRVVLSIAIVSACTLVTPYGAAPFTMTSTLLGSAYITAHIGEWQPPNFQVKRDGLAYFLALVMVLPVFGIRLSGPRLLVFVLLAILALSYNRGLFTFLLLAPIVIAVPVAQSMRYLARQGEDATDPDAPPADPVVALLARRSRLVLAACIVVFCAVQIVAGSRPIAPAAWMSPKAAIDHVRRTGISGNVFNEYAFGGFLITEGIPTFIDGRAELFSKSDTLRNYYAARDCEDLGKAFVLFEQYKIAWMILAPDAPLAKAMAREPQWDRVFSDNHAVVFVRRKA